LIVKPRPLTCQAVKRHTFLTLTDQSLTMKQMSERITVRLDAETMSILRELQKRLGKSKSEVIRSALSDYWRMVTEETRPTSWEVYQRLYPQLPAPRKGQPLHDRARHVSRLVKEKLIAKRRKGTL
jgi:Arc/MetJ-type ribon-helix-helix transcriptional regulator